MHSLVKGTDRMDPASRVAASGKNGREASREKLPRRIEEGQRWLKGGLRLLPLISQVGIAKRQKAKAC